MNKPALTLHPAAPLPTLTALPPLRALTDDEWTPERRALADTLAEDLYTLAAEPDGPPADFRLYAVPTPYLWLDVAATGSAYRVPYTDTDLDAGTLRTLDLRITDLDAIIRAVPAPESRQVRRHAAQQAAKRAARKARRQGRA